MDKGNEIKKILIKVTAFFTAGIIAGTTYHFSNDRKAKITQEIIPQKSSNLVINDDITIVEIVLPDRKEEVINKREINLNHSLEENEYLIADDFNENKNIQNTDNTLFLETLNRVLKYWDYIGLINEEEILNLGDIIKKPDIITLETVNIAVANALNKDAISIYAISSMEYQTSLIPTNINESYQNKQLYANSILMYSFNTNAKTAKEYEENISKLLNKSYFKTLLEINNNNYLDYINKDVQSLLYNKLLAKELTPIAYINYLENFKGMFNLNDDVIKTEILEKLHEYQKTQLTNDEENILNNELSMFTKFCNNELTDELIIRYQSNIPLNQKDLFLKTIKAIKDEFDCNNYLIYEENINNIHIVYTSKDNIKYCRDDNTLYIPSDINDNDFLEIMKQVMTKALGDENKVENEILIKGFTSNDKIANEYLQLLFKKFGKDFVEENICNKGYTKFLYELSLLENMSGIKEIMQKASLIPFDNETEHKKVIKLLDNLLNPIMIDNKDKMFFYEREDDDDDYNQQSDSGTISTPPTKPEDIIVAPDKPDIPTNNPELGEGEVDKDLDFVPTSITNFKILIKKL